MSMLQCGSTQRQIAFGRTHNVATNMTGVIEVHDVWGALGGTKQSCGVIATRRCANRPRMTCRVSRVASVCTVLNVCRHTADRTLHNCSTTCRNWCWQSNLLSCSLGVYSTPRSPRRPGVGAWCGFSESTRTCPHTQPASRQSGRTHPLARGLTDIQTKKCCDDKA